MKKQNKLYCKATLKNNDIYLRLYYNTHEIKLMDVIVYILTPKNNEYIIDPLINTSRTTKSTLKKFGFTNLDVDIIEMIRQYDVVDSMDLILKSKDNPDEIPKLSVDEYLKLNDHLQKKNRYELKPKQDALQHKLNFIAHLLKTYKHTVIQAVATKTDSSETVVANNIDDIINLLKG